MQETLTGDHQENPSKPKPSRWSLAAQRALEISLEAAFRRLQTREQKALARIREKTSNDPAAVARWYETRFSERAIARELEIPFLAYAALLSEFTKATQDKFRQHARHRATIYRHAAIRRARRGKEPSSVEHLVAREIQTII